MPRMVAMSCVLAAIVVLAATPATAAAARQGTLNPPAALPLPQTAAGAAAHGMGRGGAAHAEDTVTAPARRTAAAEAAQAAQAAQAAALGAADDNDDLSLVAQMLLLQVGERLDAAAGDLSAVSAHSDAVLAARAAARMATAASSHSAAASQAEEQGVFGALLKGGGSGSKGSAADKEACFACEFVWCVWCCGGALPESLCFLLFLTSSRLVPHVPSLRAFGVWVAALSRRRIYASLPQSSEPPPTDQVKAMFDDICNTSPPVFANGCSIMRDQIYDMVEDFAKQVAFTQLCEYAQVCWKGLMM